MAWMIDVQRDGAMFTVTHEAGRTMLDGVFRAEIPESMRMKVLNLISEAPAMYELLKLLGSEMGTAVQTVITQTGSRENAIAAQPGLFKIHDMIAAQLAAAEGRS